MKLKALLRDDFVDDPSMEPDAAYAPVKLPMLTLGYTFSTYECEVVVICLCFLLSTSEMGLRNT
jgi:hypothetical protein